MASVSHSELFADHKLIPSDNLLWEVTLLYTAIDYTDVL